MAFIKNKQTRVLIIIMGAFVVLGLASAHLYYSNINSSVDPRVATARVLYEKYNEYALQNRFESVIHLMDSIENIYKQVEHYKNSYEIAVVNNNRAATLITQALFYSGTDSVLMDSLITKAELYSRKSIDIYETWLNKYAGKQQDVVDKIIHHDFYLGLEDYSKEEQQSYFKTRKKEVEEAMLENKRRLSVSYTNLGITYRHNAKYDSAAIFYQKAIDLWDENLTARNNLNVLLGRPMEKRSFIQKLFPPKKD